MKKLLLLVAAGCLGLLLSTPAQAQFYSRYPAPAATGVSVGVVTPNFGFYSSFGGSPAWRAPDCAPVVPVPVPVRPYPAYYPVVPVRPVPFVPPHFHHHHGRRYYDPVPVPYGPRVTPYPRGW